MSARRDYTSIGGADEAFPLTHWTQMVHMSAEQEPSGRAAMGQFLARYWKPVYCYLRRRGVSNEDAKDLTQGFFQEVILARGLIRRSRRERGRFRTLLLTALNNYINSVHRARTARKRMPATGLVGLGSVDWAAAPQPASRATPEDAFNYAWASALIDQVIADVERQCHAAGKAVHWQVFCGRLLRPLLDNTEPVPLAALCDQHGIANEVRASNMVITVKRRFQAAMRNHVRQFVDSQEQVEREIQDLMAALSAGRAAT